LVVAAIVHFTLEGHNGQDLSFFVGDTALLVPLVLDAFLEGAHKRV
jgi:hypothetical protein